ncbi:MAG: DNA topoisomerase VI subunit B [Thermoguttaceae bacterium]|nr:DNA topoisomerase VI subunit B [Thermoguttaceae bacterium]
MSETRTGTTELSSRKRRATAESMAQSQKNISVSEFFMKNRHLLGFDNPRKALLTTVKEAVDNSLDACEEAGILPEIWVGIDQTGENRYRVYIQDNGPGIVKKQIPPIFGKLLYGSKFHKLKMTRGQQGIGISAAGMYGALTTGKPVLVMSQISKRNAFYCELKINTKTNEPEILNNRGEGVVIPAAQAEREECMKVNNIQWEDVPHGTRITIELEATFFRGRGSVDEYIEQTAIANPHATIHYKSPLDDNYTTIARSTDQLPPEAKEIKPHPYGVELGLLATMLKDSKEPTMSSFLTKSFSKVSPVKAQEICGKVGLSTSMKPGKVEHDQVDKLYKTIQATKLPNPSTECLSPIGEELLIKGMHTVMPGEFYTAATRPPAVYRGNPFQLEVGLVYGSTTATQQVSKDLLLELLDETDTRTLRQFLMMTFYGLGADGADKILAKAKIGTRKSPKGLSEREINQLFDAMHNLNLSEGQTMNVMRYANRVPLQFQEGACAITQTIKSMNWRSYGLSQSRGALPSGPVSIMVHLASVWVPFTSESKEAIALYPEIQKELRLALQTVGRKLGMYLRRRMKVKQEADRRQQFLRYLGEIATATSAISGVNKDELHQKLIELAKSKTSMADVELDENGRPIEQPQQSPTEMDLGDNVLIVEQDAMQFIHRASNGTGQQKFDFDDSDEESESGDGADEQEGQDQQE